MYVVFRRVDDEPVVEDDIAVRADESRLRRLLENLFRNAVEHGSTGSRPEADDSAEHGSVADVTVTVGPLPDEFYVADDGPGLPDDGDVFETGYTADRGDGVRARHRRSDRGRTRVVGRRRRSRRRRGAFRASKLRRLARLDREIGLGVGDAGQRVAVVEFAVVEHLLVVVDDVVLGTAAGGDLPGTGDTLPLPAGVG